MDYPAYWERAICTVCRVAFAFICFQCPWFSPEANQYRSTLKNGKKKHQNKGILNCAEREAEVFVIKKSRCRTETYGTSDTWSFSMLLLIRYFPAAAWLHRIKKQTNNNINNNPVGLFCEVLSILHSASIACLTKSCVSSGIRLVPPQNERLPRSPNLDI